MKPARSPNALRVACVLALTSLGLMVWSVLDPRPIPVIVAMSVGQLFGTLSFVVFLVVVLSSRPSLDVSVSSDTSP